jgi:hypothetical protein
MTPASELRSGKTDRDENFPVASWIIHKRHRALILAFYNFVRTADDIADHPLLDASTKLTMLDELETGLLGEHDEQAEANTLREAFAERGMPPRHALDLLTAFRMDVTKLRYADWDELIHYCSFSAMPVASCWKCMARTKRHGPRRMPSARRCRSTITCRIAPRITASSTACICRRTSCSDMASAWKRSTSQNRRRNCWRVCAISWRATRRCCTKATA